MPKLALKLYLLLVSELHTIQGDEETLKVGKQLEPLTLTPATRTRGLWSHKTSETRSLDLRVLLGNLKFSQKTPGSCHSYVSFISSRSHNLS